MAIAEDDKKSNGVEMAVTGAASAIGAGAAIFSLAGPIWLALLGGAVAGAVGIAVTKDAPKT